MLKGVDATHELNRVQASDEQGIRAMMKHRGAEFVMKNTVPLMGTTEPDDALLLELMS